MRNEFRSNVQKFSSQISHAMQQIAGDVHIQIPDVNLGDTPEARTEAMGNYETVVNPLIMALEDWTKAVSGVVDQETRKQPRGKGPLAEIEFWRQRNAALSTLYEQLSTNRVKEYLDALQNSHEAATLLPTYTYHFTELTKMSVKPRALTHMRSRVPLKPHPNPNPRPNPNPTCAERSGTSRQKTT